MAPETAARFGFVNGPRHGFGQIARAGQRAVRGESEPPDRVVVAHSRLVKPPVEVEEKRLPDGLPAPIAQASGAERDAPPPLTE